MLKINERDQLQHHIAGLQDAQNALVNERDNLQNYVSNLETLQSQLIQERDQLKNHVAELQDTQNALMNERDQLQHHVKDLNYTIFEKSDYINYLKKNIIEKFFLKLKRIAKKNAIIYNTYFFYKNYFFYKKIKVNEEINSIYKIEFEEKIRKPLISVIVPNYNHKNYLKERLESIYSQTYENFEVILLDDNSIDGSLDILKKYQKYHSKNTRLFTNDINSGSPFSQWKKGITLANGELIWIAESDDISDNKFLENMVHFFYNDSVNLAFCRTNFITSSKENVIWTSEEYLSDLVGSDDINKSFIFPANELVNKYWGIKNIIPNVSACIFRKKKNNEIFDDCDFYKMQVCGDWLFYLFIIKGGLVAFTNKTTNYYRQHNKNTSVNNNNDLIFYKEHKIVLSKMSVLYKLDNDVFLKHKQSLFNHWIRLNPGKEDLFQKVYNVDSVNNDLRKKNLMFVIYALSSGGGETFPIFLANGFSKRGYNVIIFNCAKEKVNEEIKEIINDNISIIELKDLSLIKSCCINMGIDIIHTHHAWCDSLVMDYIGDDIKHIISMHGMYEMMDKITLDNIKNKIVKLNVKIVYTAEKNLIPFNSSFIENKEMIKIENSLPFFNIKNISRLDLGIDKQSFVFCLVARGIPEKGIRESIDAVIDANSLSNRKIELIYIGDGPEYDKLKKIKYPSYIHICGHKKNIRDYFYIADMGLISSRFKGESAPLVIIDCLYAKKPIIASNIGEIKKMIQTENGLAGCVFDLENWEIPIQKLTSLMLEYANNDELYKSVKNNAEKAISKFNFEKTLDKYEEIYKQ